MALRSGRSGFAKLGGIAGVGIGVLDGAMTYYDRRSENPQESKMTSAAFAAGDMALWTFLPQLAIAKEGYSIAKSMGEAGMFNGNNIQAKQSKYYQTGSNWNFQDTQQAATMRQRGIEAMQQSRTMARSALGGEARALHRGAL